MMPLLDVVFLLLTFFIFAVAVMELVKTSGVELLSVEGSAQAVDEQVVVLEVDGQGGVLIDGAAVADDELDGRLREIAARADKPPMVLALQAAEASIDRGQIVLDLQQRIQRAGIKSLNVLNSGAGSGVSR